MQILTLLLAFEVLIVFSNKISWSPNVQDFRRWSYLETKSFSSVQSLRHVRLFATPWTAAHQASLSITNSWSSLKLMSIELVMPSSHLILCRPLLLLPPIPPSIRVFSNELTLRMRWPSVGVSASASVLPMNTQDWSPLEWTGWISLQSKGLSRVFSNTTVQKHQFFSTQLSSYTYIYPSINHNITLWNLTDFVFPKYDGETTLGKHFQSKREKSGRRNRDGSQAI